MTNKLKVPQKFITATAFFLLAFAPLRAQQEGTQVQKKDDQPKPAAATSPWAPDSEIQTRDDQESPQGPTSPYSASIKDASTGLPLFGTSRTPLRWGSFSIYEFEYIGLHSDFDAPATATQTVDLAIFRTGLMFDHALFKDSRITLQYLPQMAIYDGQVHANAAMNNTLSLGTRFSLTPRLMLILNDSFVQTHSNPLIPQNYFSSNGTIGAATQNNFFTTNGNFLSNTGTATFEYALSPRTSLTFSGMGRYANTTNNAIGYQTDGEAYGGTVSLGHALTPRRKVGIANSFQYLNQHAFGGTQSARYDTISAFYTEQLARTFWLTLNAGAIDQSYSGLSQADEWGFNGTVSILKNLSSRANFSLTYGRGISFNNYVSLQRSDRVDAALDLLLTSRISWSNSFGYYRELGGTPRTLGKYGVSNLQYRFAGNFSLFATFSYETVGSGTPQLLPGESRLLAYGLRWSPPWTPR